MITPSEARLRVTNVSKNLIYYVSISAVNTSAKIVKMGKFIKTSKTLTIMPGVCKRFEDFLPDDIIPLRIIIRVEWGDTYSIRNIDAHSSVVLMGLLELEKCIDTRRNSIHNEEYTPLLKENYLNTTGSELVARYMVRFNDIPVECIPEPNTIVYRYIRDVLLSIISYNRQIKKNYKYQGDGQDLIFGDHYFIVRNGFIRREQIIKILSKIYPDKYSQ